jgi:hypothetical protein
MDSLRLHEHLHVFLREEVIRWESPGYLGYHSYFTYYGYRCYLGKP